MVREILSITSIHVLSSKLWQKSRNSQGTLSVPERLNAELVITLAILFDEQGLPKPFSRAPRLTVYRRELYDYAECINLATLLRGRFPALDERLSTVLTDLLDPMAKA